MPLLVAPNRSTGFGTGLLVIVLRFAGFASRLDGGNLASREGGRLITYAYPVIAGGDRWPDITGSGVIGGRGYLIVPHAPWGNNQRQRSPVGARLPAMTSVQTPPKSRQKKPQDAHLTSCGKNVVFFSLSPKARTVKRCSAPSGRRFRKPGGWHRRSPCPAPQYQRPCRGLAW